MSQQPPGAANQLLTLPGGDGGSSLGSFSAPPTPPWWRQRRFIWIAVILLIILIAGILFTIFNQPRPINYQRHTVSTGDLSINVSATGPIQSGVYNVIFSGSGIIDEINVKVGDTVTKGQVLASLNKTSLQDAVNQQQTALDSAQATLDSAMASLGAAQNQAGVGSSVQQTAVANAQSNVGTTQNQSQASVAQAQQALNSSQKALNETKKVSQSNISTAQTALNNAQQSLSKTQQSANASKQLANQQLQQELAACNAPPAPTPTTPTTSNSTIFVPLIANASCQDLARAKQRQAVAQADQSISTAQQQVNTAQKNLANAKTQGQQSIANAQAQVDNNQKALALAKTNAAASNENAQDQVDTAEGQLDNTQAGNNTSIQSAQSQVISAQNGVEQALKLLETAKHNIDNAILKAPNDGIVSVVNGSVGGAPGVPTSGTSSSAGGSTFIQIVDNTKLQIIANVNESDTANLKVGQQSTFTVNSFGERQFNGTVSAISPNGQTVSNVVTYPVYIDVTMDELRGANLFPGMTANVSITVINRTNVLLAPVNAVNFARLASTGNPQAGIPQLITREDANNAVIQARNKMLELQQQNPDLLAQSPLPAFVLMQLGERVVPQPVVLGLTDGTVYEVLDGLSANDSIIVGIEGQAGSQ